jgi:polysaccharide export outer membrane protein
MANKTHGKLRAGFRLAAGFALILAWGSVQAQFSGPALGMTPQGIQTPTPTTDPAILMAGARDLPINSGDLLSVRIFGTTDFAAPVRVTIDGNIQLPFIGLVPVAGLSVNHAEDLIAQRLSNAGIYNNPQVTVTVAEAANQFVSVGGEMHAIVPVAGERRLLDVLAAAGTFPLTASRVITIVRPGLDKPIVVDLGSDPARSAQNNIRILPGDAILVSRVGVVYMLGAFKQQGAIPLQQNSPLTLMQATSLAQGAGYEGQFDDLHIVRTVGLERKEVKIDIKKVMLGKAPDPILQADDIVFLPTNALKAAIKGGAVNTVASLASVLLIAFQSHL